MAIIFVHGVMGTATDTFTAVHSKAFWPELLRDDALFNDVDIYTFGYKSEWFSKGLTVKQLAQEMHIALSAAGIESRYEKLIFVCHSMGGLVTRSYMTSYPNEVRGKVSFLYFFGTPSSGSEIATVGRLILPNSQLGDLAVRAGEPFLIDLQSQWLSAGYGRTIPAYCAYEARKMGPAFIVPAGRAAGLCNQSLIAIEANHVELVKPENLDDKPHLALRAAFQESVRAQSQNDVKLIPSNSVTLSYDARSERFSFLFKVVVKSSRGAGDVIEEMYSTLQGPADDKRIPFSDGDHDCVRDDDEVQRPFLFNASEITCVVSQQLGDLTREAISVGGDHRIVVTFETEDQRGHTLEYCFSLDQSDIDNLLKDSGRHQFRYAVCRG
jgi:pimeloyl-ACP methyl ester carboxylesterase